MPNGWTWIRQSNLCWLDNGNKTQSGELPYLEAKVIRQNKPDKYQTSGVVVDSNFKLILVDGENSGEIFTPPFKGYMGSTFKILDVTSEIYFQYLLLIFELNLDLYRNSKTGAAIPHLNKKLFKENLIALPPLNEQLRIVKKLSEFDPLLERYQNIEKELSSYETSFEEKLKASILQYAIEGKLVKQDPNDEPASKLLERIKSEKERLIKEGKIKRDKHDSEIIQSDDKNYYGDLPKTWLIIKIGQVLDVYRGGSPRPIESFLTTKQGGINWVKIGDTIQGDKYIVSCKQKIIKDGLSKTRLIQPGDLLLTNSMSFGRPYISKIYGAVHDGWLVFSDFSNSFDKDYLFYLLSSVSILEQFKSTVSGAVVKNLNIDKVKNTNIPLLSKNEQTRIAKRIESIFLTL